MKQFAVPNIYRSTLISAIKNKRKKENEYTNITMILYYKLKHFNAQSKPPTAVQTKIIILPNILRDRLVSELNITSLVIKHKNKNSSLI